jgi:hypothetical protein
VNVRLADGRPAALAIPRQVILALALLVAAVCLLQMALATLDRPTHAVVWGSLALASYAASLLCLAGVGRSGFGLASWRFGPWILLWYSLAFGLATVTSIQPQTKTPAQIDLSDVLRALVLVAVGMTCWVLGYFGGPGQPARRLAARLMDGVGDRFTGEVRSALTPWTLYVIGLAARLAATATTGRFGYVGDAAAAVSTASGYGQVLSLLSLCAPLAVAAAALQAYRERKLGARVTLAVLFFVELGFGAAAGGKQSFIITLLAVVVPISAARRRLPKKAVIAGIVLFLMVVIPFNRAYREVVRGGSASLSPSQAFQVAPEILRQTVSSDNTATAVPASVTFLLQRVREIDSPAIIMQRTPGQVAFSSPVQLAEVPISEIVPRAIWRNKPIETTGYQFSQQYYGLPATLYTSSAITPVGDLYRHGGWIPVIGGMFLLGCLVRLLDDVIDVRRNPHAIFLVLLLFPTLVKGEDDWASTLAGVPTTVLFWLLAVSLTFRRRRSG